MKTYLLLATCLLAAGCGRQEANHREVMSKLDAIRGELNKGVAPVRWATANKSEITTFIYKCSRDKVEQIKKSDALPAETEAKILEFEALRMELLQMGVLFPNRPLRLPPGFGQAESPSANKEYEALSKRVAEAKVPIAAIVDRRERQAAQYREQYSIERLIAEYAKDRFDLVVDSTDERLSHSGVLYRTAGEVTDITEGIIALIKARANQ
jgi:hypothetical protein